MEHRSFSARFRRNGRKGNTTATASPSPGHSPVIAPANDAHDANDVSPSTTTPPILTITTADTPPSSSHSDSHSLFRQPKSPFGKFHLRSSHKRARSPAPAALPQPTSPAVVKQDGILDHEMMSPDKSHAAATPSGVKGRHQQGGDVRGQQQQQQQQPPPPKIPAFLNMSEQDILSKYNEIIWNERNRMLQATTNPSPTFKFARVDAAFRTLDRYGNIQPWNNNRVKLQVPEGSPDYINASPIVIHSPLAPAERPPHKYIAMQGPTGRTSEHVWRMVTEQLESPAVMVMLTETHENNMEKCYPYYPDAVDDMIEIGEHDEFQDGWRAQVKCTDIEQKAEGAIEMRQLQVQVDGQEDDMEVWHLLYKKWPDFGVPALEDIDSFLELMALSREKNASDDNPRVVHCSAGVGRSGTFIALEHLMREIDSGDLERYDEMQGTEATDLVFDTVNTLREQRKMMVQAEPQYLFIYQVLRKQWMEKYGIKEDQSEPAAKRLGVGKDPFVEDD
ncbi:putative Tyrosine-protein phosphatase 2 [Seiridium cardinale]